MIAFRFLCACVLALVVTAVATPTAEAGGHCNQAFGFSAGFAQPSFFVAQPQQFNFGSRAFFSAPFGAPVARVVVPQPAAVQVNIEQRRFFRGPPVRRAPVQQFNFGF
jgi:hypothetical protein